MKFSTFNTVFKKEFTNIRKNPSAFFLAFLLPFFFVIFFVSMVVSIGDSENKKNETINIALYIKDDKNLYNVYDNDTTSYHEEYIFIKENILTENNYSFLKTDDAFADCSKGKIDLILTVDKNIKNITTDFSSIDIYYI